ncbi:MAG: DUF3857 and transglutaminase domain-containing protein [Cyclobacteriaceae bacterium]|nr:DUF3857 and transglutaminase domain-containing protein [Cyclobacteriaceae bacterium]MCK5371159.1 DUF3857 and transglutaminase domain-containing protein [Cyclobacteriaceae bacterium]
MKKEWGIKFTATLFILFFINTVVSARIDWNEKLKIEKGLVIEQYQNVEITVGDDGNLDIVAHIYEETQYFRQNANMYSEQSIRYSNSFSEINDIEAYSLIPTEKNKYKKIKIKDFVTSDSRSAGIFYDDQKKISYLFPALKENSKTVISYTKKYKEPRLWGYYMFSSFFPVEKSVYSVKVPESVKLNFHKYGIDDDQVNFTIEKKGKYNIYKWTAERLNKIQMSKGANGVLHTAPHLIIYVDSYTHNGVVHNVLRDVNDLHAWYQNFLKGIDDEDYDDMKIMVENIIEGKSTELGKVESIYDWVQQNIKYIAIEDGLGGFRPRTSNTVFTRRYGDCKDMSNLIHEMLNLANIPSNLAWIGTTAIPYSHREVPTPMADNHMICTYVNNDRYYFLDATDQYNILGIPTTHIQGREALINKGTNDFELVNVPIVPSEKNQVVDSVFLKIENDKLIGSGQAVYSGYKKIPVANNLENLSEDDKKAFLNLLLKKGNNKFLLNSVTTKNVSENYNDLLINYDFSIEDYILKYSDEIFINPHLSKELENGMIDLNRTKKDVHYSYKSLISNIFCISIPENFKVSFLPEDTQYDGDDFSFSINYKVKDNKVIVHQKVEINTLQLKTEQFDSWNKMIKGLFSAYKESVVLGRI